MSPVHPVAPVTLSAVAHAWNATVLWNWKDDGYSSLALGCQVELTCMGVKTKVCCGYGSRVGVELTQHPESFTSTPVPVHTDLSHTMSCSVGEN